MSNEKNPYESQNTLDIPNFSEKEKAVRQEVNQEVKPVVKEIKKEVRREVKRESSQEESIKKAPKKEKSFKLSESVLLVGVIALVALLLLSLFSVIYAINQRNALKAKEAEYVALQDTLKSTEDKYETQLKNLQDQIEALTVKEEPKVDEEKVKQYEIIAEMLNVRASADVNADQVDAYPEGAKVLVYGDLVEGSDGKKWGKISDGHWICVVDNDGTEYAKAIE